MWAEMESVRFASYKVSVFAVLVENAATGVYIFFLQIVFVDDHDLTARALFMEDNTD